MTVDTKTYDVDVSWTVTTTLSIEANSPEEAEKLADAMNIDEMDTEYLSGSFQIDGVIES